MKRLVLAAILIAGCASVRMRVDRDRIGKIETIAPVTFVGNRFVLPPEGGTGPFLPSEQSDATAEMIFTDGIPAFLEAIRGTERFKVTAPERVLAAKSYRAFSPAVDAMGNGVQLAHGWSYVRPEQAEKIQNLLEEIDADAALLTYWKFTLDARTQGGVGLEMATTRVHLRAWLIDRDGKIVGDDEIDVPTDLALEVHNGHYDREAATPLFEDAITTCAVRMIADFANARAKARGQ